MPRRPKWEWQYKRIFFQINLLAFSLHTTNDINHAIITTTTTSFSEQLSIINKTVDMAQNRDSEYAMQVWKFSEVYINGNDETSSIQHFGFQPEELADEFNQSTVELLSNALNAMRAKVGGSH